MVEIRKLTEEFEGFCKDESRSVGYAESISFPETEMDTRRKYQRKRLPFCM